MAEVRTSSSVDAFAQEAIRSIQPGMTVGLGTGRSATRAIRALAERVRLDRMSIRCVATSHASELAATELGLEVHPFGKVEKVDVLFDGVDEIDPKLRMLKGQHGAVARQRLVARAADRRIYLGDEAKLVSRLGTQATLPVAVLAFGLAFVREELRNVGLSGVIRRRMDGEQYVTDDGNLVIDVTLPDRDPEQVALDLDSLPGVVDHGLFITEADEVLLETKTGQVRRLVREG